MSKALVRRSFDRAAASYDQSAQLQRQVCAALADLLTPPPPGTLLLDAGCGTGYGARLLAERFPDHPLVLADFAPAMLARARAQTPERPAVCADVEALPFANRRFGLYWSSLTLQWCDLHQSLAEAARVLVPGGQLAFSTLGPGTFAEIDAAFAGIDRHRHVLPFAPPQSSAAAALAAGLKEVRIERRRLALHYPDLRSLLRAIKDIGANQVGAPRRPVLLGRSAWRAVEARYEEFRTPAGLPATYDVILCTALK
ncbi:MAG TPA: malonyl-ACP O-methyltransferase BioC [Azospira sp.]|nr:malonyl-ACP O-methyltransferase BioC [Azospira sp.]